MARPSSFGWWAACALTALTLTACGGPARVVQGPSPKATEGAAALTSGFVPLDAGGKAGPLCFASGVLPNLALRLDAGGRYVALRIGDLHDVAIDDEGTWSQPKAGAIALDSERWVPGFDTGVIAVERVEPSKMSTTFGHLRDGWKALLAAHADATFSAADVKAIDPASVSIEDASVPRRHVEAALAGADERLASKTPTRVLADVGTYREVTWLARGDDDPASLSGAKAAIDELLAKGDAKKWIAEGTSPFYTLVDAGRCRVKPNM